MTEQRRVSFLTRNGAGDSKPYSPTTGFLVKENALTVIVKHSAGRKSHHIKRHKRKHQVEILAGEKWVPKELL